MRGFYVCCSELAGQWSDYEHRDKICDGVIFHVKYLGSTLVSELEEEGQSYGDSISAEAVKAIVNMVSSYLILAKIIHRACEVKLDSSGHFRERMDHPDTHR